MNLCRLSFSKINKYLLLLVNCMPNDSITSTTSHYVYLHDLQYVNGISHILRDFLLQTID